MWCRVGRGWKLGRERKEAQGWSVEGAGRNRKDVVTIVVKKDKNQVVLPGGLAQWVSPACGPTGKKADSRSGYQ